MFPLHDPHCGGDKDHPTEGEKQVLHGLVPRCQDNRTALFEKLFKKNRPNARRKEGLVIGSTECWLAAPWVRKLEMLELAHDEVDDHDDISCHLLFYRNSFGNRRQQQRLLSHSVQEHQKLLPWKCVPGIQRQASKQLKTKSHSCIKFLKTYHGR